jgi:alanine racemase
MTNLVPKFFGMDDDCKRWMTVYHAASIIHPMFSAPTAHIHLGHLQHNARLARQLAPGSKLMAVVKANAYGHGLPEIVHSLHMVDGFAVARFDEAIELRQYESHKPALVLGGVYNHNELDSCLQHAIDVVVHQDEQLALLCEHKPARATKIAVWLKIDTGMHRLGIAPESFHSYYQKLSALPFISRVIAMTHFASADESKNTFTQTQIDIFHHRIAGMANIETSLANSAGLIHWPQSHGDWVRPGLMLYGIRPDAACTLDLKPVMTLDAPIVALHRIAANETVGYNQTWRATHASTIATVCFGYGDGYPTQIKPGTPVLLHGQRVPIVGRVSMDLITVDVTGLPQTRTGDKVIFWGEDAQGIRLPVEEIAQCVGTIPYTLVTQTGRRVHYQYSGGD